MTGPAKRATLRGRRRDRLRGVVRQEPLRRRRGERQQDVGVCHGKLRPVVARALGGLLAWVESQLPYEERQLRERKGRASPGLLAGRKSASSSSSLAAGSAGGGGSGSSGSSGSSASAAAAALGLLHPSELPNHRLGVFYAATQAVFYVMCFRGASLHRQLLHQRANYEAAAAAGGTSEGAGSGGATAACSLQEAPWQRSLGSSRSTTPLVK